MEPLLSIRNLRVNFRLDKDTTFEAVKGITFDIPHRQLNVGLTTAEIEKRLASWTPPAPRFSDGVMAKYALLVSSPSLGAVTTPPASLTASAQPLQNVRSV